MFICTLYFKDDSMLRRLEALSHISSMWYDHVSLESKHKLRCLWVSTFCNTTPLTRLLENKSKYWLDISLIQMRHIGDQYLATLIPASITDANFYYVNCDMLYVQFQSLIYCLSPTTMTKIIVVYTFKEGLIAHVKNRICLHCDYRKTVPITRLAWQTCCTWTITQCVIKLKFNALGTIATQ